MRVRVEQNAGIGQTASTGEALVTDEVEAALLDVCARQPTRVIESGGRRQRRHLPVPRATLSNALQPRRKLWVERGA
jgi:hypothetical protein